MTAIAARNLEHLSCPMLPALSTVAMTATVKVSSAFDSNVFILQWVFGREDFLRTARFPIYLFRRF